MVPDGSGVASGAAFGAVVAGAPAGITGACVPPYGEGAFPPPGAQEDSATTRRAAVTSLRTSFIRRGCPAGCLERSLVTTAAY